MKIKSLQVVLIMVLFFLTSLSCSRDMSLFQKSSPWQQYSSRLESADLFQSKSGKYWLMVSEKALEQPLEMNLPFRVDGSFKSKSIEAHGYAFNINEGATLALQVDWEPGDSSLLFLDLFSVESEPMKRIASFAQCGEVCPVNIRNSGRYVLRLQPELLAEGNFSVSVSNAPTYTTFPVQNYNAKAVQSLFGVSRDGGVRSHEGVDIFARKGTFVVAPTKGIVTAVKTGGRGGKSVWLRDLEKGYNLYFAHLDSQYVSFGNWLEPGDIIGTVGNTGNAKTTPSHLHFGVYRGSAIDPFPLIDNINPQPKAPEVELEEELMMVRAAKGNMRKGPSTDFDVVSSLNRNEVLFVDAVSKSWYQVRSATGEKGFMHRSLLGITWDQPMDSTETIVYHQPEMYADDSLRVSLEEFRKIGESRQYSYIADGDNNLYFLP